jgi:hypothetical protein
MTEDWNATTAVMREPGSYVVRSSSFEIRSAARCLIRTPTFTEQQKCSSRMRIEVGRNAGFQEHGLLDSNCIAQNVKAKYPDHLVSPREYLGGNYAIWDPDAGAYYNT